jgi:hypothetical protein
MELWLYDYSSEIIRYLAGEILLSGVEADIHSFIHTLSHNY